MNEDVKNIIEEVTTQTVVKLKKSNLMKENKKPPFKKTEELLRNYNGYKMAIENHLENTVKTKKLVKIIDYALSTIEDDPYYSVIEMIFFEHKTREEIAEFYDCDIKTVTRNKNRLVNQLKIILFSDNTIEEIFLWKVPFYGAFLL